MIVIIVPVAAKNSSRIDNPSDIDIKTGFYKHGVGQQADGSAASITKRMYPDKAMMSYCSFQQIVFGALISTDKIQQFRHIFFNLHPFGRQMLRLIYF